MGTSFQTVAFPGVPETEAEAMASKLLDHLVARGVLLSEANPTDRQSDYAPGPSAEEFTEPGFEHTRELRVNRMVFETGRSVFHAGQNGIELACRVCGVEFSPESTIGDLVQQWYYGDDNVSLACPSCGPSERLVE